MGILTHIEVLRIPACSLMASSTDTSSIRWKNLRKDVKKASLSSVVEASFLLSTTVDIMAPVVAGSETRLELRARMICIYIARNKTAVLG